MIEAEIDPRDLREFMLDMDALHLERLLEGELGPFAKAVGVAAGKYPPPVSGSTYIRTHNLDRNWYYKLLSALSVEVGNLAVYAGYVHGHEQVDFHAAHGWRRLFEMGDTMLENFIEKLIRKAERIWK